jgi:peptide/nickel transport system substrate-binding protein
LIARPRFAPRPSRRRPRPLAMLGLALVAGLAACSGDTVTSEEAVAGTAAASDDGDAQDAADPVADEDPAADGATADEAAAGDPGDDAAGTGDERTVVLAVSREPSTMSPLFLDISAGNWPAFDGLLRYGPGLELEPDLAAELPEVSDDGRTVTVRLRDDVTFHDGEPFTATDVAFTWDAVRDPELASPVYATWNLEDIEAVVADDDHTVRFELAAPDADLLDKLTLGIVPAHLLRDADLTGSEFDRAPVGTGPFVFEELRPDDRLVFTANPDHHRGGPAVDRLVYTFLPDENARAAALQDGTIDAANLPPRLAQTLADDDIFTIHEVPSASVEQMTLPNDHPALSEAEVRRAISMAVDREALVETVQAGTGAVAVGPFVAEQDEFDPDLPADHDPDAAAAMLDDLGWEPGEDGIRERDGERLAFTVMYLPDITAHQEIGLAMRSDLAAIGIEVDLEGVDSPLWEDRLETDAWLHGVGDPYTPAPALTSRFHSRFADDGDPGTNRARMRSDEVDALLDTATATTDPDERQQALVDLQTALLDDGSYLHLLQRAHTVVARTEVEGFDPQLMGSPHAFPRGLLWNVDEWQVTDPDAR